VRRGKVSPSGIEPLIEPLEVTGSTRPVAIGLGANLGDRLASLQNAAIALTDLLIEPSFSRVYETDPLHLTDQPPFLNACATGLTDRSPQALLAALHEIERAGGRQARRVRYGPRVIDLDVLLFDDLEMDTEDLTIPHPGLHERAFALVPLAELAPNWQHSGLGRSVAELADSVGREGIRLTDLQLRPPARGREVGGRGEGCSTG
jgi:2-amino-4-hydroxy-6-hydroxymethyldihydropteridine diphosphokinase